MGKAFFRFPCSVSKAIAFPEYLIERCSVFAFFVSEDTIDFVFGVSIDYISRRFGVCGTMSVGFHIWSKKGGMENVMHFPMLREF